MFTRLHKLGLTMSYPATLLLLDTLGSTYDVKVIEWKEKQLDVLQEDLVR